MVDSELKSLRKTLRRSIDDARKRGLVNDLSSARVGILMRTLPVDKLKALIADVKGHLVAGRKFFVRMPG